MNTRKMITTSFVAGAVALAIAGIASTDAQANKMEKEKCYGVVKAGQNDCKAADGSHSCMSQSKVDGDGGEFVALPKGVCEKLVGGALEAKAGDAASGDHEG